MTVLLIALGAALGAPLRYLTDRAVQARHDSVLPWGTLTVNVAGSLLLGALPIVTVVLAFGMRLHRVGRIVFRIGIHTPTRDLFRVNCSRCSLLSLHG